MRDGQDLLAKIAALRQRLEQARGLVNDAGATEFAARVRDGGEVDAWLDTSLRRLTGTAAGEALPRQLTARARRLLEQGRELLHRLRLLGDELDFLQPPDGSEPLADWYQATVAMADSALRTIGIFPDAPSVQLHLSEGVAVILDTVAQRVARLAGAIQSRRQDKERVDALADFLAGLAAGRPVTTEPLVTLAWAVQQEAGEGAPLRFLQAGPEQPERFVACHGLNVARVLARVVRQDPDWSRRPLDALLAALVHDVGMLAVPPEILAGPGPLDDEARRLIEGHCWRGAEAVSRLFPGAAWLSEAVAQHHERTDGTGYPGGLLHGEIAPLARLLAVADVYAALCAPRPHRPARDTRTALTDTLLLAEQGLLDQSRAEQLLVLTFYPAGSVVELADGAVGVVVAMPPAAGVVAPDRPILALLADAQGRPLPFPHPLDLTRCEGHAVVRSLTPRERCAILGKDYPEFI